MAKVWGFDRQTGDMSLFSSEAAWEAQVDEKVAQRYLRDHLRAQLTREIPTAARAYDQYYMDTGVGTGFWTLLRSVFGTITFLGALHSGEKEPFHAVVFVEKYLGDLPGKDAYKKFFALLYSQYRHGLAHNAMPKSFERADGLVVGWHTSNILERHLTIDRTPGGKGPNQANVVLCPEALSQDVCLAIDEYSRDFDVQVERMRLLANFKKGFLMMGEIFTIDRLDSMRTRVKASLDAL